ncbi:binding-protein-dependent transport systems inner membrane component [Caballeronia arvi]|uniref:Binding-protein-dependent transport systems inner membrane component n=1 Tax=Caballeronia arvi TaxID=1777135 RepID=A0A158IQA3_9BURK|nr:ABC transporter permease [Caballeronia arvi]SAL58872.1 binding-protein-dependent transport systems inner membrane component [Caballeronia arvi]
MIARGVVRIVAWLVLAYLALPLVIIVGASVTQSQFLAFPPKGITLHWYGVAMQDASYMSAFATSTVLAAVATVVSVVMAVSASIALTRFEVPGRGVIEAVLMSPLVLPSLVLGAAILQYGSAIGMVRSFSALLVGHVVIIFPLVMRSVLPQLVGGLRSLEEASFDLGATPIETFFLVVLPQIKGGVISGAVLAFITSWINVEMSIFNTTPALTTMPVKLFNYVQYTIDPTIAAVSAISILGAAAALVVLDLLFGLDVLPKSN